MRNIDKERQIELEITNILREKFYLRFISFECEAKRIGTLGIESKVIGTVASCNLCKPSDNWLGKYSPLPQIKNGKLWLSQHLTSEGLTEQYKNEIDDAIINTKQKLIYGNSL